MSTSECTAPRELSDAECGEVSGGDCTCGYGANCVTSTTVSNGDGSTTTIGLNCSGGVTHYLYQQ